ncbi:MAG: hypothetical protein KJ060_10095 [Candidatus Hydrogenedentes bacterium]|nr:hypothetical protein [Candidatus Hydrogenedentota bacterium]
MILLTVLVASAIAGQLSPPQEGAHYKVFTKDGGEHYALCEKVQGDVWIFQLIGPDGVDTRVFPRDKIQDYEAVTEDEIQQHIDAARTARGEVKTGSGWVAKDVYDLAQGAREAAQAQLEQFQNSGDDAALVAQLRERSQSDTAEAPSALSLWGPQIALIAGALVLIGIIVKLVILGGEPAAEG